MSRTKRWMDLVHAATNTVVHTYHWEEDDETTREDDPFNGSYTPNLISGRKQAQPQRNEATTHDSNTTLPEAR